VLLDEETVLLDEAVEDEAVDEDAVDEDAVDDEAVDDEAVDDEAVDDETELLELLPDTTLELATLTAEMMVLSLGREAPMLCFNQHVPEPEP
jgi:hypothetical protein